jgi:hypothetical protein
MRGTIRGSLFTAVRFSAIHAMTLATSDSVLISSASKKWTAKRNAQLASTFSVARSIQHAGQCGLDHGVDEEVPLKFLY